MKPKNIELHIEELTVHGFSGADQSHIGEAVKKELSRLLLERGVPPSIVRDAETARLDGGEFEVKPGSGAEAIGAQVARAVYGGLSR
jgi:hypothetical protein